MTGPNWPRKRYELMVKKGTAPLGLKLHQTKTKRGVYANAFTEGSYPPPGPQACMRVGDLLVSVEGKDVAGATLTAALSAIEAARRRDRLRDFISSKQDDPKRGSIVLIFERVSPKLFFHDVALDPRKVVYLMNYMLEVRRNTESLGEVSLDEARLMFWLEAHVLFEMAAVMTPTRGDMAKIFEKFFREESGFYLSDTVDPRQLKQASRRSWENQASPRGASMATPPLILGSPPEDRPTFGAFPHAEGSLNGANGHDSRRYSEASTEAEGATGAVADFKEVGNGAFGVGADSKRDSTASWSNVNGEASPEKALAKVSSPTRTPRMLLRSSSSVSVPSSDGDAVKASPIFSRDVSLEGSASSLSSPTTSLPVEMNMTDLARMFQSTMLKVEEALVDGCFHRFQTSPWYGRMVAHLSGSPDYVHVPFERIMAEPELRDVMMLHMVTSQLPGWLQVWREVETSIKPRLTVLQTRRSVRHRLTTARKAGVGGALGGRRSTFSAFGEAGRSAGSGVANANGSGGGSGNVHGGVYGGGGVEAKSDAAMAILASACFLWDFFLSHEAHASLGLAQDDQAYVALRELLGEGDTPGSVSTAMAGGSGQESGGSLPGAGLGSNGDEAVDLAVSVGKALLDIQREVLRKLCASVYPDFQASGTYEHLCDELTSSARSPRRSSGGHPGGATGSSSPDPSSHGTSLSDGNPASENGYSTYPPSSPDSSEHSHAAVGTEKGTAMSPPHHFASSNGRSRSQFTFLGSNGNTGGSSPSRSESLQHHHLRWSPVAGAGESCNGGSDGGSREPWADMLVSRHGGGRAARDMEASMSVSGPDFASLWERCHGCVLEKVMRRIELPSHVSRHRPPLAGDAPAGDGGEWGQGGCGGSSSKPSRRLSRSGSGASVVPGSRDIRQHLSLPYAVRRFGRRPYSITPAAAMANSGVDGSVEGERRGSSYAFGRHDASSSTSATGRTTRGWKVELPTYRADDASPGHGAGLDASGLEMLGIGVPGGDGGQAPGVASGGGVDGAGEGCAEWVMSFSSSLEHGVTTVKPIQAARVRPGRKGSPDAAPEGLEPFFCPDLPASGKGPCECTPEGVDDEEPRGSRKQPSRRSSSGTDGAVERGAGASSEGSTSHSGCPPPRLFTFAAPGRNGAGTYYGACLTVFRPVAQWVGEAQLAAPTEESGSSSSPLPSATSSSANVHNGAAMAGAPPSEAESTVEPTGATWVASNPSTSGSARAVSALLPNGHGNGAAGGGGDGDAGPSSVSAVEGGMSGIASAAAAVGAVAVAVAMSVAPGSGSSETLSSLSSSSSPSSPERRRRSDPTAGSGVSAGVSVAVAVPAPSETMVSAEMYKQEDGGTPADGGTAKDLNLPPAPTEESMPTEGSGNGAAPLAEIPSRFKMTIGMFGSSRSSGSSKGSGGGAKTSSSAGKGSGATSGGGSSAITKAPPSTPGRKFSSYARRAGNLLGAADSRAIVRSSRVFLSQPAPVVENNGLPPSEIRLASHSQHSGSSHSESVAGEPKNEPTSSGGDGPRTVDTVNGTRPRSATVPLDYGNAGHEAGTPEHQLVTPLDTTGVDVGALGEAEGNGTVGSSPGGTGSVASVSVGGGPQRHVFYMPSGLCLLSTRPESGAMRRALASYWRTHGRNAVDSSAGIGPRASPFSSGGGGSRVDPGPCGSDHAEDIFADNALNDGGGGGDDGDDDAVGTHECSWARLGDRELVALVSPFLSLDAEGELVAETASTGSGTSSPDGEGSSPLSASSATARSGSVAEFAARAHETLRPPIRANPPAAASGGWGFDFDPSVVLRCLNPRHICMVVTALLCERKVILVSARLSLLSMAGEVFRALLYPLSWSHVYVPLLPRRMAGDLLQCPTPFLLGLLTDTAKRVELPKDAVKVHLDMDYLAAPEDFVGLAPMSLLCERLCSIVNPGVGTLDDPSSCAFIGGGAWTERTASDIRWSFREFVSELLQGAAECTFEVGQGATLSVLLDERLYKRAKAAAAERADRYRVSSVRAQREAFGLLRGEGKGGPLYNRHCAPLIDQFVKTQMLSHYLSEGTWESWDR